MARRAARLAACVERYAVTTLGQAPGDLRRGSGSAGGARQPRVHRLALEARRLGDSGADDPAGVVHRDRYIRSLLVRFPIHLALDGGCLLEICPESLFPAIDHVHIS